MLKPDLSQYVKDTHILSTAVILIDTREQENKHIIDYFDKHKIAYESRKLEYGDYSLRLPKNVEYGLPNDLVLDYAVERKGSLEELSGNFTNDRDRIENELWRASGRMTMVVEDGSLDKIMAHEYKTQYNEKSFISTLVSFQHRYNLPIHFVSKNRVGAVIYALLHYKLREEIK